MKLEDILKNAKDMPTYMLERKINKLIRENPRFSNLSTANKRLIMDLIEDRYLPNFRRGIKASYSKIRQDKNKLYRNRIKLDLTEEDLDDIDDILDMFK